MTSTTTSASKRVGYFDTFRHYKTKQVLWPQVLLQLLLPVAISLVFLNRGFRVAALSDLLSGLAIVTGFLFTLLVFIFQLRLQMNGDQRFANRKSLKQLIDELFAQVNWAILVALISVVSVIFLISLLDPNAHLDRYGSALFAALTLHLLAVLLACAMRTRAAYDELVKHQ